MGEEAEKGVDNGDEVYDVDEDEICGMRVVHDMARWCFLLGSIPDSQLRFSLSGSGQYIPSCQARFVLNEVIVRLSFELPCWPWGSSRTPAQHQSLITAHLPTRRARLP